MIDLTTNSVCQSDLNAAANTPLDFAGHFQKNQISFVMIGLDLGPQNATLSAAIEDKTRNG